MRAVAAGGVQGERAIINLISSANPEVIRRIDIFVNSAGYKDTDYDRIPDKDDKCPTEYYTFTNSPDLGCGFIKTVHLVIGFRFETSSAGRWLLVS